MNKTVKLSLAAALAAGIVTSASAKTALEDAITNTTIKGYVDYKMTDETKNDGNDQEAFHDIDVRVQIDSKLTDNYSLTVRIDEEEDEDDKEDSADTNGDKDSSALQPEIDHVYFTYKNADTKIKAGLQKVVAPRLHDSAIGDGIIASQKISEALTLVGGYFYNSGLGTDEIAGVAAAGKVGIVDYGVTYATIIDSDTEDGNDGTADDNGAKVIDLTVDAAISDAVNIHGAYTTKSFDDEANNEKDQKLLKLVLSGKASSVKYALAYAMGGEDGADVSLDSDADAEVNLQLEEVDSTAFGKDGSAIYAMVGASLSDTVSAKFEYVTAEDDEATALDADEYMITLSHKASDNLTFSASYDSWDVNDEADSQTILRAKLTF